MADCIFCKIVAGEFESYCIYEDELFKVILDKFPASAGHALILTKKHIENVYELGGKEAAALGDIVVKMSKILKEKLGCEGLNVLQNNGEMAGQVINHFHMHLIPRYNGDGIVMKWAMGKVEDEEIREVWEKLR